MALFFGATSPHQRRTARLHSLKVGSLILIPIRIFRFNLNQHGRTTRPKEDDVISKTTQALCEEMKQRDVMGYGKYSTTVDRDDLKPSEWCQHAIEEKMDDLKYLKRLKQELEEMGK